MKKIVKSLIYIIFCKIFYRVEYINKENEEKLQKCIICPNHSNTVEPSFIYAKTNNLNIMAKAELFKHKAVASLLYHFDVFPINRGKSDIKSLLHAIHIFKTDKEAKLLIFPEGHRIPKTKERGDAKFGPTYIAGKANVPIVPVYITKNAKLFSKVKIIYGEPIYMDSNVLEDKDKIAKFSENLLNKIYELKDQNKK